MKKKLISICLAAVLATAVLTSCGESAGGTAEQAAEAEEAAKEAREAEEAAKAAEKPAFSREIFPRPRIKFSKC